MFNNVLAIRFANEPDWRSASPEFIERITPVALSKLGLTSGAGFLDFLEDVTDPSAFWVMWFPIQTDGEYNA